MQLCGEGESELGKARLAGGFGVREVGVLRQAMVTINEESRRMSLI